MCVRTCDVDVGESGEDDEADDADDADAIVPVRKTVAWWGAPSCA